MFFFFKQKTAYEVRISDWSSDVCSSDLGERALLHRGRQSGHLDLDRHRMGNPCILRRGGDGRDGFLRHQRARVKTVPLHEADLGATFAVARGHWRYAHLSGRDRGITRSKHSAALCRPARSEEHTSELQSLMRISYAVFCLKKKK